MYDLDIAVMLCEPLLLELGEVAADFNDIITCTIIHIRVILLQEVKDAFGQRTVSCANFVDDKVLIWEVLEKVLGHETLCKGLAIIRLRIP